jgi:hypothetical protein
MQNGIPFFSRIIVKLHNSAILPILPRNILFIRRTIQKSLNRIGGKSP